MKSTEQTEKKSEPFDPGNSGFADPFQASPPKY